MADIKEIRATLDYLVEEMSHERDENKWIDITKQWHQLHDIYGYLIHNETTTTERWIKRRVRLKNAIQAPRAPLIINTLSNPTDPVFLWRIKRQLLTYLQENDMRWYNNSGGYNSDVD